MMKPDIVEDMISVGLTLLGAPQKQGRLSLDYNLLKQFLQEKDFIGKRL